MTASHCNPFGPQLVADPYPAYAQYLEDEPFFHAPSKYWVVSRYAEVRQVVHDPRFSRADFRARAHAVLGESPLARVLNGFLLFRDPPDHTRLRRLISQVFTPKAVARLRDQVQQVVDGLIERAAIDGDIDLIAEVAYPLPVQVICALLGVPEADHTRFRAWSAGLLEGMEAISNPQPEAIARGNAAVEVIVAYFRDLVAQRRAAPTDDLISDLIAARDGNDRLSEHELLATCALLFFAGHETTVNLIGNGMLALLRHPDQLKLLRYQPELIANAVEELLRYDSPIQRTFRLAAEDVQFGNQRIRAGDQVMVMLGAANRDPRRFADPDRLDVLRADASQHLSFGGGIHYCVGAPLARMEAQVALTTLLQRLPGLRMREAPAWRPSLIFRGLRNLPLVFDARLKAA